MKINKIDFYYSVFEESLLSDLASFSACALLNPSPSKTSTNSSYLHFSSSGCCSSSLGASSYCGCCSSSLCSDSFYTIELLWDCWDFPSSWDLSVAYYSFFSISDSDKKGTLSLNIILILLWRTSFESSNIILILELISFSSYSAAASFGFDSSIGSGLIDFA